VIEFLPQKGSKKFTKNPEFDAFPVCGLK